MVEQYRYPVRRRAWEFPQGSWSQGAEGEEADLARAELMEETGLRPAILRRLGHLYGAYGFCSQGFDVFLALGLTQGETARERTELDMAHRFVHDQELAQMILAGDIVDAASLAAHSLFQLHVRPPV
jgi:8-oxo-dGTP pyrophosphatase MutT (NUDIX family)